MDRRKRGRWGEAKAVDFLEKKGYIIIERNFISRGGEIDIIAKDREQLVFVEVKVLLTYDCTELERIVGPKKQRRIRNTALEFLAKKGLDVEQPLRCDIVAIVSTRHNLLHFENAF